MLHVNPTCCYTIFNLPSLPSSRRRSEIKSVRSNFPCYTCVFKKELSMEVVLNVSAFPFLCIV